MATGDPVRAAVLIPTYNNATTLRDVVERTLLQLPDVLVVNDGSTDDTTAILEELGERITVHHHPENRGKGTALRTGFELLREGGFTHAITLDSDGQLFPEDLPRFVEAIERDPRALVVGQRDMRRVGAPRRSRFGLWFSNLSLRLLTGVRLDDTQTGFRAYPLAQLREIEFRGTRFDFEMEVLVRSAWNGVPIVPIPIEVSYAPEGGRVSHFRPVRDFLHIGKMNVRLLLTRGR